MSQQQKPAQQAEYELYKRIKQLGEGAFGKAYLVQCLKDKTLWVQKQMELKSMSDEEKREALKEAKILEAFNHPNIVKFREVYKTKKGKLCIIMEYADGGDLAKTIKDQNKKPFSENVILDFFVQICLAIKHVHDRKIIHRDLKGQNIFLTKNNMIKLGDFGIARVLSQTFDKAKTQVGTPYYLSPEVIESKPYSFKTDIWSMGVILYELCAQQPPFNADSLHFLALKIVRGSYNPIPNQYSKELKDLIALMLRLDPQKRPGISDILKLPLIQKRIQLFLTESQRKYEFSHTILHNKRFVSNNVQMSDCQTINQEIPCPPQLLQQIQQQEQQQKAAQNVQQQQIQKEKEAQLKREQQEREKQRVKEKQLQKEQQEREKKIDLIKQKEEELLQIARKKQLAEFQLQQQQIQQGMKNKNYHYDGKNQNYNAQNYHYNINNNQSQQQQQKQQQEIIYNQKQKANNNNNESPVSQTPQNKNNKQNKSEYEVNNQRQSQQQQLPPKQQQIPFYLQAQIEREQNKKKFEEGGGLGALLVNPQFENKKQKKPENQYQIQQNPQQQKPPKQRESSVEKQKLKDQVQQQDEFRKEKILQLKQEMQQKKQNEQEYKNSKEEKEEIQKQKKFQEKEQKELLLEQQRNQMRQDRINQQGRKSKIENVEWMGQIKPQEELASERSDLSTTLEIESNKKENNQNGNNNNNKQAWNIPSSKKRSPKDIPVEIYVNEKHNQKVNSALKNFDEYEIEEEQKEIEKMIQKSKQEEHQLNKQMQLEQEEYEQNIQKMEQKLNRQNLDKQRSVEDQQLEADQEYEDQDQYQRDDLEDSSEDFNNKENSNDDDYRDEDQYKQDFEQDSDQQQQQNQEKQEYIKGINNQALQGEDYENYIYCKMIEEMQEVVKNVNNLVDKNLQNQENQNKYQYTNIFGKTQIENESVNDQQDREDDEIEPEFGTGVLENLENQKQFISDKNEEQCLTYLADNSRLEALRVQLEDVFGIDHFIKAYQLIKQEIDENGLQAIEQVNNTELYKSLLSFIDKEMMDDYIKLLTTLIVLEDRVEKLHNQF